MLEKLRNQIALVDSTSVEDAFMKSVNRHDGVDAPGFNAAIESLNFIVTSRECLVIFNTLKSRVKGKGKDIPVQDILAQLQDVGAGGKAKRKATRDRKEIKSSSVGFLPANVLNDVEQTILALHEGSTVSLSQQLLSFSDKNKLQSDGSCVLNRRQFLQTYEKIGGQLTDEEMTILFESFDISGDGYISSHDIVLWMSSISHGFDDSDVAASILRKILAKKKFSVKEVTKSLAANDRKKTGFVETGTFEKVFTKVVGSSRLLSSTDMSELCNFFDPSGDGRLDIGLVGALIHSVIDGNKASPVKLKHLFRLMRVQGIEYSKHLLGDSDEENDNKRSNKRSSMVSVEDALLLFADLSIPMSACEIMNVMLPHSIDGKVKMASVLDSVEKLEVALSSTGKSGLFGRGKGSKDAENFGKCMFQKLCKLRANSVKCEEFRRTLMERDPDLVGYLNKRDLQRALDRFTDLTDAESNLLTENLCFADGSHRSDIDYSLLLLVLLEPIEKIEEPIAAGSGLMKKLLRGSDSVSLRRLLALLFRNFAASDDRATGLVPYNAAEKVLLEECPAAERKDLGKLLDPFCDESSDCIMYPELLAFLGCCSLWNVMYRLHIINRIRKKQGYNFGEFLVNYSKKVGKKMDRAKAGDLFLGIGMLLPETALETIFSMYSKDSAHMDTTLFVNGLNEVETIDGDEEGGSRRKDRREIEAFEGDSEEQLLKEYDERLVNALVRAFELFDPDGNDCIPSVELERVLCALGQPFTHTELRDLIERIGVNSDDELEYDKFMEHVIPFLRGKYAEAHAMSKSMIHDSFRCLDVNGDGFLTHGELKYVLMNASSHVTAEECTSLIEYLDVDRNGSIDWFEFQKLYDLLHDPDALQELPSLTRLAIKKV